MTSEEFKLWERTVNDPVASKEFLDSVALIEDSELFDLYQTARSLAIWHPDRGAFRGLNPLGSLRPCFSDKEADVFYKVFLKRYKKRMKNYRKKLEKQVSSSILSEMIKLFSLSCALFVVGCEECPIISNASGFSVRNEVVTPRGVSVDLSGQEVSLNTIDNIVDDLENCLFHEVPAMSAWDRKQAGCDRTTFYSFTGKIDRSSFTIKIDENWRLSADGTRMLTSAEADQRSCEQKGLDPTKDCPCRWQAAVQDCDIVVVPPSLYNLKDPVLRIVLGCDYPWANSILSKCLNPIVPMLPENFDPDGRYCWQ